MSDDSASSMLLPPNLQRAWELLSETGPLTAAELRQLLRQDGIVLAGDRIDALPHRHPTAFAALADGRLEATTQLDIDLEVEATDPAPLVLPHVQAVDPLRVAIIDIETTGLDRNHDDIWEIAAVLLDESDQFVCRVATEDDTALPPVDKGVSILSPANAIERLSDFIATAEAIGGQAVAEFDLPFLAATAERAGVTFTPPSPTVDLIELSTLVLPGMPTRRLGDICVELDIAFEPHRALSDATATAEAIRALLARVDPADPSWALALACLALAGHPLSRLLPAPSAIPSLEDALRPADDPLCAPAAGRSWSSAREAGALGLKALEGERSGFRVRSSQREMADRVGAAQDDGGALAVEAPTGTGKSLGYLLPSAGRAESGRPVVIATATKVLQTQLRDDAVDLRERGLLRVPFRQLQGVANYICTRELAESFDDPDDDPASWLALAVAVRGLATTPTGTWNDVTDGVLQRRDPRYRSIRHTLRTDANGCERRQCPWVTRCPMFHRLRGIEDEPGLLSVNHALVATWIGNAGDQDDSPSHDGDTDARPLRSPTDVLARGRPDLVFDEAHDLEDTLTSAWTEELSEFGLAALVGSLGARRGAIRLGRRALRALGRGKDHPTLVELVAARHELADAADQLAAAVRVYVHEYGGSGAEAVLQRGISDRRPEFRDMRSAAVRTRLGVLRIRRSASGLIDALRAPGGEHDSRPAAVSAALSRLFALVRQLEEPIQLLESLRDLPDSHLWLHRLAIDFRDQEAGPWRYERVPIHISGRFSDDVVRRAHSIVLTSATLRVAGSFDFLAQRLGVRIRPGSDEEGVFSGLVLASPFDCERQSAVVLTNHLPVPVPVSEREFCEEMAADQVGFLSLSGGKALTLFAARKRMAEVADRVREREVQLAERGVQVITQDEVSRIELASRFREDEGTVAYGLRSYWQGFDAKGDTLTYLFIEKPPYPHPDDALVRARQRALEDIGADPFLSYVVPKTAILMAQGFGRLIRDEDDKGVAIICDRRLQSPSTANQMLLDSLPGPTRHEAIDRADAWTFAIEFATGVAPNLEDALSLPLDDVSALLEELRLEVGEDPEDKLRRAAKALFGIDQVRDEQMELMRAFLEGRDALGVMPTGSGKSLCFQLPALLAPEDRATVVVSPLVALIKDQVDDLRGRRGLRPVQGITGRTSGALRTEILRDVNDGRVRLLYVSPERLVRDPTLAEALSTQQLQGLVVDEAHCVSIWGHDFRPEFRQIPKAVARFKRSPRLALTATATPDVAEDIEESLDLDDPLHVRAPADRPNLRFRVIECGDERARARQLLRIVLAMAGQPGIVYTGRRATSEEVAALLRAAGVAARHYHAGLVPEQREAIQDDFFSGNTRVIVATKAFGMGINKPDIGWVVHYDLPESLDNYAQEAGRAAREPALVGECVLLFTKADIARRLGQARKSSARSSTALAGRLVDLLEGCRRRGASVVFDPEYMADQLGAEEDELNVALAWLERVGVLERELDCSTRGMVTRGVREPANPEERRHFLELFTTIIRTSPQKASQLDFATLEDERHLDPDELESDLVRWSLDRLISFSSTRRAWRVRLTGRPLDEVAYADGIERFRRWGEERLRRMIGYGRDGGCRRLAISRHFGDVGQSCSDLPAAVACDQCGADAGSWEDLADHEVPDPETIIQVDVTVLKAVAWASRYTSGRYGEAGLKAAVLGNEAFANGHPIGAGLLNCPLFGSLRYVRAKERRYDEAVAQLLDDGFIERVEAEHPTGRSYHSLVLTDLGERALGVPSG